MLNVSSAGPRTQERRLRTEKTSEFEITSHNTAPTPSQSQIPASGASRAPPRRRPKRWSLCCCSAAGRRFLLPRLFFFQHHQVRRSLLHLPTTTTATPAAGAASSSATPLSPPPQQQVSLYVDALLDWNQLSLTLWTSSLALALNPRSLRGYWPSCGLFAAQRMNLTAVTDEAEVMKRHVVDSLAVLPPLEGAYTSHGGDIGGISIVDVGSGAGLPGLILAVARPSWKFTLLESMRKRCTFLELAVEVMGLSNVDVVCDRAEIAGQSLDFRESFDVGVAKAVAELKILAEYCLPLVCVGGLFIAAKGHDPHEEIRSTKGAVHKLDASMLELCNVESMGPHGQRTAVVYLKERTTPKEYPRHPGTPSKTPL